MGDVVEGKTEIKRRLIREGKRVPRVDNINLKLVLKIVRGFTNNESLWQRHRGPAYYRVMAWTNGEKEYGTKGIKSLGNFLWFDEELVIPLDSPSDQYLYIELLRGILWEDPGSWNGTTVMGRAKIPLPLRTSRGEFTSKVELVRLNSDGCLVFTGNLELSMKLHEGVIMNII